MFFILFLGISQVVKTLRKRDEARLKTLAQNSNKKRWVELEQCVPKQVSQTDAQYLRVAIQQWKKRLKSVKSSITSFQKAKDSSTSTNPWLGETRNFCRLFGRLDQKLSGCISKRGDGRRSCKN